MNGLADLLYQLIDIIPPPVRKGQIGTGSCIGLFVIKFRRRIKVIIKLNAIHIIICDDFFHAVTDELANLRKSRVEIVSAITGHYPFRMLFGRRIFRQRRKI